jgi:deoxyribodipyrimidine photo-lyase
MNHKNIALVWFRQDLRLADNPALTAAVESGAQIIPLYILDDASAGEWRMGGAARVWLHHSLAALNQSLDGNMVFLKGDAKAILPDLIQKTGAQAVYWNRCYEPWRIKRDQSIKDDLKSRGIQVQSFNGSLLWEPWDVLKDDGTPYKVFTPFYRKGCLGKADPRMPFLPPHPLRYAQLPTPIGEMVGVKGIDDLKLLPQSPDPRWDIDMVKEWTIGEAGAQQRLNDFLSNGLNNYKEGRNIPAGHNVSRLSPHLHFGEVSPNQVWHTAKVAGMAQGLEKDLDHFLSELGWREFSHSLLYHFPTLPRQNLQGRFDVFPWQDNPAMLHAWQRGQTGYPIVDAAMRELWHTGYMHNRTRMIVGSFLVKNLLLHWHHGEDWFWDCLFDADLANNAASWQWIAGCGADAAPYFRIFNPITQGEKFDPDGAYIRKFVPELKNMPNDFIHKPWEASPLILKAAGVELGATYPHPIVDHAGAREKALAAFEKTKKP